jgi:hypothetical protein
MNRLLLLLAVCALLPAARADHRDDRSRNDDRRGRGPRVIVYQHADYRGNALVLYPGDTLDNLANMTFEDGGRLNDSISSIRVEEGAEIYVYADSRFRGPVMRLAENARDLTRRMLPDSINASWNDRISSLRVEQRRRGPGGRRVDPDEILRNAFRDLLGREPDLSGLGSLRSMIVDQGWTEEMVRDNIRRGDEFRHEGANRIIRQAYQDVLGREPRPDELDRYRRILLERDWLGNDVREELKRSGEYRRNPRRR